MPKPILNFSGAILRTYSILLFSQERWLGIMLLVVSFFNPTAGACGLVAVGASIAIAYLTGLRRDGIFSGLYSFNALLVGIGMGTFYETGIAFSIVLLAAVLLTVMLSAILAAWLGKYGLPFLSLPFIFTFWLVLLATKEFSHIGLSQRNIYWLNEMYAAGGKPLISFFQEIENCGLPEIMKSYFRSLSALFFQSNVLAGIIIASGLLIFSRIGFSLSVLGFICAYSFNMLTGAYDAGINYYNLGSNFMMVTIAIGGFFSIPSTASYLWAVWSVPLTSLLVIGLGKIFGVLLLPVFSLPFCFIVIAFIYFMQQRVIAGKLKLTVIQNYSPEKNLYQFLNGQERWKDLYYFRFFPPFLGEWTVSQGYEGALTHKGDWSKALDFVILDSEMKTFSGEGRKPEDYYCFNKPVLSPADGIVEEISDNVDDNPIGEVNTVENWGNTIVIRHLTGLYSKMSHLKKNSFRVKKGDVVHRGDILALCGNSGRSPEPHLHFQVQAFPFIGAKTLEYPFAYFLTRKNKKIDLHNFSVPVEGDLVSNLDFHHALQKAFRFQPGFISKFNVTCGDEKWTETWEVFTDAWNNLYIWSKEKNCTAYFVNNGTAFYFTSIYGGENSLLHYFYLSCYRVVLAYLPDIEVKDNFPLHVLKNSPVRVLQDFTAPFFRFMKQDFSLIYKESSDSLIGNELVLHASVNSNYLGKKKRLQDSLISIVDGKLSNMKIKLSTKTIEAICVSEN
jgi:urea transporter